MRFVEERQGVIILVFILLLILILVIVIVIVIVILVMIIILLLLDMILFLVLVVTGVSTGRHWIHGFTQHAQRLRGYLARRKRIAKRAKRSGEPTEGSIDTSIDAAVDALLSGMPIAQPAVPKQANGFDCGVFALQYAEEMMVRWPECRASLIKFSPSMTSRYQDTTKT